MKMQFELKRNMAIRPAYRPIAEIHCEPNPMNFLHLKSKDEYHLSVRVGVNFECLPHDLEAARLSAQRLLIHKLYSDALAKLREELVL